MKTLTSLFRPALFALALPATLAFSACGNDDDNNSTPMPDQGKVQIVHAAAAANTQVSAVFDSQQAGQLTYGQNTGYVGVGVGTPSLRIVNGSNTTVATQQVAIAKDQNYSAFVYSPTATIGSASLLFVTDNLTAPASNQAKVRVVHLAVGAPSPVRLTAPSALAGGTSTDLTPDVAFGAASDFVTINAGPYSLSITGGNPRSQILAVGDGTGSGTKTYEGGKIYTIVVRGIVGAGVPTDQQPKAVIVSNN
ncbi:DUF4397 domain-containing protein [Hymenobacter pini]|uniref:DUF4397 domain-containing protein n=1 Tax=Hymenobacter pini TaxID=2880879 RepID=UPI001CF4DB45|nr:DUF4397 domain-containing protein [Hymenobacter pini]MCA8831758.1 DUF4397 domain-containing protein [Hymenobacter pini]